MNSIAAAAYDQQDLIVMRHIRLIKSGIWLYFFLLIFEGALRKWFLPSLATPLLIIRDPLAVWLIFMAWKVKLLHQNFYLLGMLGIGIVAIITALISGHGNLFVALYGARIFLLQFPIIFIIGFLFEREDVIRMGKVVLILSIPMAVLIAFQFYSPQSSWVNRGVGGDIEGAGFSGALGYFRPPGTFSFTTGNSQFFSLVACFLFYFLIAPQKKMGLLLIAASIALVISIPLSISRTLFFQVGVSIVFLLIAVIRNPKFLSRLVIAIICVSIALVMLSNTIFFQTATEAFTSRFESASNDEGGLEGTLIDRFLGGMVSAIQKSSRQPFFGYGIGMGTNVGSMLLTGGKTFLIAEEEWGRLIGEMGAYMGLLVIFIRLKLIIQIGIASFKKLSANDFLPWMLLSFGCLMIAQAQWAQPTALGFTILIGGLIVASFNKQCSSAQEN